ncbi:MAG: carbon-nitrogen hydrolase family protein [Chitinophagaceae bacterium]|nr:carbon-nitrogen hydrolase family protein [Chitinophagaceae bacterium]
MKICAAQIRPVKGNVQTNINRHKELIGLAVANGADLVFFPELSVTGYEPELAKELATDKEDSRFDILQQLSDEHRIIITAGMPIKSEMGVLIGMIIFQPYQPRQLYAKQHLHSDEYPYFVAGRDNVFIKKDEHVISFAICYELFVPEHAALASKKGADIYIASVAKTPEGMMKASPTLSEIAGRYSMSVVLSNYVGHCDNFDCGGNSAAWNNKGILTGQLDEINEGILIVDTDTHGVTKEVYGADRRSFI